MDQRPTLTYLIFGVGQPSLERLQEIPRRQPNDEEVRAFARTMGHSVVTLEPVWVLEVTATAEEVEQLYGSDRAILSYCPQRKVLL